jgi:hypothetical protein
MKKSLGFLGIFGAVLFFAGILGAMALGTFSQPLIAGHIVLGILSLALWFLVSGVKNLGRASAAAVTGRGARFSFNALLYLAVFLGILALINYTAHRHNKTWDTTQEGVFSLTSESVSVIGNLSRPVRVVAFLGIDNANRAELVTFLEKYREQNRRFFTYEILDLRTAPQLAQKYDLSSGNLMYIEYGEEDVKSVSRINERSEESVTNAILKLTRGEAKKIYYLIGYDQPSLDAQYPAGLRAFSSAIEDDHLSMEPLLLLEHQEVPRDAAALILAAPQRDLSALEEKMLIEYVEAGGRLAMFNQPGGAQSISRIASHFDITVGDDIVLDLEHSFFLGPVVGAQVVIRDFGSHMITDGMGEQTPVVFNISSSVVPPAEALDESVRYTSLLMSSPNSWAESDYAPLFEGAQDYVPSPDASELRGPVSLAVIYEKSLESDFESSDELAGLFEQSSRLIVFGDIDWIMNRYINQVSNRQLILNTLNWLAGEEGGFSIRPRSFRVSYAPISRDNFMFLLASSLIVPELILLLGLFIWWKRKS